MPAMMISGSVKTKYSTFSPRRTPSVSMPMAASIKSAACSATCRSPRRHASTMPGKISQVRNTVGRAEDCRMNV